MGNLVQHHQNISNPFIEQLKYGDLFMHSSRQKYQIYCKSDSSLLWGSKLMNQNLLNKKNAFFWTKCNLTQNIKLNTNVFF